MALQIDFLAKIQSSDARVSIFLINGIKLIGTIESFDDSVILLKNGNNNQIIYKHAISTIVPEYPYDI